MEANEIAAIVNDIIVAQKADTSFDYRPKLVELDACLADLYGLKPGRRFATGR
jgi:hypothetical protein